MQGYLTNIIKCKKKDKKVIPGIYNYCDRWCERCSFTSRCANYSRAEKYSSTPEDNDINNEKFWENLHKIFQETMQILLQEMKKYGIDINDQNLEEIEASEKQKDEIIQAHQLVQAAKNYYPKVSTWLEENHILFEMKSKNFQLQSNLNLPNNTPEQEATEITNALDVITWYQHKIYIKLVRAISSKIEEKEEPPDDYQKILTDLPKLHSSE